MNWQSCNVDYEHREDRIKILGGLTENDMTFSYVGLHTRIKNDLLAIVQNTIVDDITFVQFLIINSFNL